ncbi:acyltransferase [Mucilaginibacter boryungensis]|uniref:Acyltransferase family protein n=1 Tax=Mucilaginibacter boryungensis TaxID=768480 RepID=A0ABR9XGT2_9SPHI|nr:acyltransferase family protein [Mucilaginibacter boryungensis]MBE9666446.1 acyltransferase family protein [Mucilaginibacter boryungensis]
MKPQRQSQQLDWINNLRVIALFAVIILHCSSPLLGGYPKVPYNEWLAADFYNALTRFAVPVFVMITGALLLGRDDELFSFLKKRLSRVVIPFLFWSLVYIAYAFYNEDIPYTTDTWANIKQVLHQLKYGSSYHLWYVYMLIGLYFIIPVLSKFIRHASEKETLYFLAVWLIVMLLGQPYMLRYNPPVDIRYFGGYIGYLVLGYYFANKSFTHKKIAVWMGLLFMVTVAGITLGTYSLYQHYNGISTLLYEPLSWPIVILASAIFLMMRFAQISLPQWLITARDFAGKYNYGIYLSHALFLTLLDAPELTGFSLSYKSFNPLFSIPLTALVCFVLSLLLVYVINKLPWIGKYISG